MTTDTVTTFFALVLLGAAIGVAAASFRPAGRASLRPVALPLAAIIAVGATLGSLYLSEVADFVPCELCWFQRIAMYPMAVLLPIATIRRDERMLRDVSVLAGIGLLISSYHIQLQLFPEQSSMCSLSAPCTAQWVEALGFMSIPQMAWISFALIIAFAAYTRSELSEETS